MVPSSRYTAKWKSKGQKVFLCRIRISNSISKFLPNSQARKTTLLERSTSINPLLSRQQFNQHKQPLHTQFYLRALHFCPVFSESSLTRQISHSWCVPKRHSEIILSLKRHYSFPNSSEQKFKLHFPITPSATSGQSNSCSISSFQNFSQSFSFAILMSTFHRLSIHTFPLMQTKTLVSKSPREIHQRSHLPRVP